jgi:hypothetical protein
MSAIHHDTEPSLSNLQRDQLLADLDRDGYIVLPCKLPPWVIDDANSFFARYVAERRKTEPCETQFYHYGAIQLDPVFRHLLVFKPAMQLCYDVFGPQFIMGQDKFEVQYPNPDHQLAGIPWHNDGPQSFPEVDGRQGFHTLRFGYMISDATAPDSGSLDVIRGSHKKPGLRARRSLVYEAVPPFREEDFTQDFVPIRGEAGTVYAFQNAIWHSAQRNCSSVTRKIVYLQYNNTWMRPAQLEQPSFYDLQSYTPEQRWLLNEPRPSVSYYHATESENQRLARFARGTD